jgi:DNA replication protein DnaC
MNTAMSTAVHGGGGMVARMDARETPGTPAPPPLPAELETLLRRLRLPYLRRTAPGVLATARAQRWEPAEVLRVLFQEEVQGRERSALATRRAVASFPTGKTFAAWEPAVSSIPLPTQQALQTLEWVGRHENLVVCGPSGTGKTFFLEALGQAAVEAGRRVAWFSLEGLGVLVRRHRADDSVTKAVRAILRADLVVVDDIGLLPVSPDAAEGFYRLVDAAYERRSVAVSSNLHPAGFDELMPKTLATATVDRLLHHAHVCVTSGDSVRLAQATAGKGVVPLPPPSPTLRATPALEARRG